jgi:hypothetical protein
VQGPSDLDVMGGILHQRGLATDDDHVHRIAHRADVAFEPVAQSPSLAAPSRFTTSKAPEGPAVVSSLGVPSPRRPKCPQSG